jgi:two-component system LytT family response regulator
MATRTRGHPPVRTLLVDDEPLALDNLRVGLEGHEDIEIIGEAGDGRLAVQLIRSLEPDLVFLDVQMPDMDGFAVLRELADVELPEIVFVTAFDQHALRAFDVHALDYLLKPFDDERFDECVRRAISHVRVHRQGELRRALQALLRQVAPEATGEADYSRSEYIERITVRGQAGIHFVATTDVDWLETTGNYVRIHAGGRQHLIRSTLNDLLERLDPRRFVRIHRSTAVNMSRIREVQPWSSGDYIAILHDGHKLKVSRTYKDDLLRPFS